MKMLEVKRLQRRAAAALASSPLLGRLGSGRSGAVITQLLTRATEPAELCRRLERSNELNLGNPVAAAVAGRHALRLGKDELLERILSDSISRFPENAELHLLRSSLASFRGDYGVALSSAKAACLLAPESAEAAARSLRLHYLALDQETADENALATLRRFGRNAQALWAASKRCSSKSHFERMLSLWRERARTPLEIAGTIRPLGNAALRVECFDTSADLYAEAALIELRQQGRGAPIKEKRLAGKGGLSVIGDLRDALDGAGVPFFLAAGTALGIVRDGKPLDHDDDIDVGIADKDWDREMLLDVFRRDPRFDLENPHSKSRKIGLIHRGGAAVDLFRFYEEGGLWFHDAVFVRWKNTPFGLEEVVLPNGPVKLPSPGDTYLTECYGDWRTPAPGFDAFVEGPNSEVTWPEYYAVHRLRRAFKMISAGDVDRARRELRETMPVPGGAKVEELLRALDI